MGRASVEKSEFWQFVVAEHSQSGLSVREFCRQEGISEPSFYQWRKKLEPRDGEATDVRSEVSGSGAQPRFLPVRVVDDVQSPRAVGVAPAGQPAGGRDCVEILTPAGYQIRIPLAALAATGTTNDLMRETVSAVAEVAGEATSC